MSKAPVARRFFRFLEIDSADRNANGEVAALCVSCFIKINVLQFSVTFAWFLLTAGWQPSPEEIGLAWAAG